jgi:hypothetical protein
VVNRQEWDEAYPWLHDLTDEQIRKIWRTYDRAHDLNGWDLGRSYKITTDDQVIDWVGFLLDPWTGHDTLESLEEELEFDEEFKLAAWVRKLRHERESPEEEQARYKHYEKVAEEAADQLAKQRRRRKPRN